MAFGKERLALARYNEAAARPLATVNPLRQTFEREKIDIADFWSAMPNVRHYTGATFRECQLHGPGTVIFHHECRLYSDVFTMCDIACIRTAPVKTAIIFERCTFDRCNFINLTIFTAVNAAEMMVAEAQRAGENLIIIGLNEPGVPVVRPDTAG